MDVEGENGIAKSVSSIGNHRDYQLHQEVEFTIEPEGIRILSLSGSAVPYPMKLCRNVDAFISVDTRITVRVIS